MRQFPNQRRVEMGLAKRVLKTKTSKSLRELELQNSKDNFLTLGIILRI